MFDFIRKQPLWEALDRGDLFERDNKVSCQLKTGRDVMIYSRDASRLKMGGGCGDFRVLRQMNLKASRNSGSLAVHSLIDGPVIPSWAMIVELAFTVEIPW
jgi:hypothetical protein